MQPDASFLRPNLPPKAFVPFLALVLACTTEAAASPSPSVDQIIEMFGHPDETVARRAVESIEDLQPEEAETAVPRLVDALVTAKTDENDQVRFYAADALRRLGPIAKAAIPPLREAMLRKEETEQVRTMAAGALGSIGATDEESVQALAKALKDPSAELCQRAAWALGEIGIVANAPVSGLIDALGDPREQVHVAAALALGRLGPEAAGAVPALTEALDGDRERLREAAVHSLAAIAGEAATTQQFDVFPDLELALRKAEEKEWPEERKTVLLNMEEYMKTLRRTDGAISILAEAMGRDSSELREVAASSLAAIACEANEQGRLYLTDALEEASQAVKKAESFGGRGDILSKMDTCIEELKEQDKGRVEIVWEFVAQNYAWVAPAILALLYCSWLSIARFIMFWLNPLRVMKWNDFLRQLDSAKAEVKWITVPIPLQRLAGLKRFDYHPRVLDAWVARRLPAARKGFGEMETVRDRGVFVPLPVVLDGQALPELTPKELRQTCNEDLWCILIEGIGGLGKTALACQMGKWAMADDPRGRLCDHPMLPVLLEPRSGIDVQKDASTFLRAVRGQLQILTGSGEVVSEELVEQLLRKRRILVILDGLSEMPLDEGSPGETRAQPGNPSFPASALVATVRSRERAPREPDAVVRPLRIDKEHLFPFIDAYLAADGRRFRDKYRSAARDQLASIGGPETEIVPLLARLYVEQWLAQADDEGRQGDPPKDIRGVILKYLNYLNRDRKSEDPDNPTIHRVAAITAWECVKGELGPASAELSDISDALTKAEVTNVAGILAYVESRLRLLRTMPPAETKVQFTPDPMAEYLAAIHLVDTWGKNRLPWKQLCKRIEAQKNAAEEIRTFLLALWHIARCEEDSVPDFVLDTVRGILALGEESSAVSCEESE